MPKYQIIKIFSIENFIDIPTNIPTHKLTNNYKKKFPIRSNTNKSLILYVVSTVLYKENTIRSFTISRFKIINVFF
jgi:hypothetical protein